MDNKSWQTSLAEAILKKPRAAFSIGAVLAILWLAGIVVSLVLFIRSQNENTLNNNSVEISELKQKVNKLENKRDSLVNLVGEVRAEGLRDKVAVKEQQNAELSALNRAVQKERDAMAQKLRELEAAAAKNNKLSEISK